MSTRAMSDEGGKAQIVLEFGDAEFMAKLTTRKTSLVGFERSSRGRTARETRQIKWK